MLEPQRQASGRRGTRVHRYLEVMMQERNDRGPEGIRILSSKLSPPRLREIVDRGRLLGELDGSSFARLTTIVAGAGFGKSTLAADFLRSRGYHYAWYQLEDTDRDLTVFLAYLSAALSSYRAELAEIGHRTVESLSGSRGDFRPELAAFLSEVEDSIHEDFFVVLDDFHEVSESAEITAAVDFLLAHLPYNLHLMILSSSELSLDLSKLRARRELVEIREDQVCFDAEETARLLSDVFSLEMEEGVVAALTELTEGWITGLILLSHTLASGQGGSICGLREELGRASPDIFEYFYRVVYRELEEDARDFLLRTSILSRIEPDFCDDLLRIGGSRSILSRLAESHLFIVPLDEAAESYRYHNLLRSFLLDLLPATFEPAQVSELHRRAADLRERRGEPEEALRHYLDAGDFQTAADRLESMARALLRANRTSYILRYIERLPEELKRDRPDLVYYLAQCHEQQGRYRMALDRYREAGALYSAAGNAASHLDCIRNVLKLSILSGKSDEAEREISEFVEVFEGSDVDMDAWYHSAAMLSAGLTYLGMAERARHFIEASLSRVEDVRDEGARIAMLTWCGYASLLLGEYRRAVELLNRARRLAKEHDFLSNLPDICCLLSFSLGALGEYVEARETAEEGLRLIGEAGEDSSSRPSLLQNRLARAICLSDTGEMEDGLRELSQLCRLVEGTEDSWLAVNCNLFSGTSYLNAGDIDRSLRYFRKTETLCRENGFIDDELLSRLSQLALTAGGRDADETRREAMSILEALQNRAAGVLRSPSFLLLASIHHQLGFIQDAVDNLVAAIAIDEESGGLGWWHAYSPLVLPVMSGVFARGEHLDFLARAFRLIGSPSLPYLYRLKKNPSREASDRAQELIEEIEERTAVPLQIEMLGPFRVKVGDLVIEDRSWKSRRASSVLKYLAAMHGRGPLQREMLMELFWPDMSPEKASKNLNVALSAVRKTLEPDAEWGVSRYLIARGSTLRLSLGEGGYVDVDLFAGKLEEAGRAAESGDAALYIRLLLEAEALYRGDFLAEDLYEDWCMPLREKTRNEYLDLLRRISEHYLEVGEHEKASACAEKILDNDPGREEAYRLLMRAGASMGDRALVERAFERCSAYLEESFEVSPSPETLQLLESLLGRR